MKYVRTKKPVELHGSLEQATQSMNKVVFEMSKDQHWYPQYIIDDLMAIYADLDDLLEEHFVVKEGV